MIYCVLCWRLRDIVNQVRVISSQWGTWNKPSMENVWVSIGERWGVENTKEKDGDAQNRGGVGPKKGHEGYITKSNGIFSWVRTPPPPWGPKRANTWGRIEEAQNCGEPARKGVRGILSKNMGILTRMSNVKRQIAIVETGIVRRHNN